LPEVPKQKSFLSTAEETTIKEAAERKVPYKSIMREREREREREVCFGVILGRGTTYHFQSKTLKNSQTIYTAN